MHLCNITADTGQQKEESIEGIPTVESVNSLQNRSKYSISVITPPTVTISILKEAFGSKEPVHFAWLQPGVSDSAVEKWIVENKFEDRVISGGPCILVQGTEYVNREQASL